MIPTKEHCHHCGVNEQSQKINPVALNSRTSHGVTYVDARCDVCGEINRHVLTPFEETVIVPPFSENNVFRGHLN